ncbi:ABC transporter substrate-binding protein [Streptomyces fuscigenes]|uniref:ABC transporter substrate-binding protein n=1 Tax=Streptomyces fuscigenes TaxID=1528880 RepID=UPI001F20EB97|nr:ABC transporter substrate-binding protein [Streptomyces fuscigenes]MCF3965185.1 ABC transporter substrate-binding protein [Streptomyces fuscigenes]
MRSIRLRILVTCVVLAIIGVGGWQLMPSGDDTAKPIKVGTTDIVSSLDPAGAYDAGSWALFNNIYQSLLTFKPSSTVPSGDAAQRCGFEGTDLLTYSCTVRDGLTFSNGDKMTGADVAFSIERVVKIKNEQGPWSLLSTMKSVEANGQTVTFHLKTPDATFPSKLATGAGAIVDRKQYPAGKLRSGDTAVGSGPYLLKAYRPGVSATLVPNPAYRGAVDQADSAVDVDYFKTPEDLDKAWQNKQIDVTHRQMPPSVVAKVDASSSDMHVTEVASAEIRNMVFNVRKSSPMGSTAVRQAVATVIDRNKITANVYDSTVEPLYSMVPQGITAHSTAFFDTYPKPDVAKAKSLLEDAGVHTPVAFTLAYSPGGAAAPEATEIRRQLDATGLFEVKVVSKEWTAFQKGYAAGDFDAYTIGWLPDYPDPDDFVAPLVGSDNTFHNGFSSSEVNDLITATQKYSQRGQASEDFKTVQKTVADDVPLLPLWQKKDYILAAENITGSQYLSDGTGIWRLWELGRI